MREGDEKNLLLSPFSLYLFSFSLSLPLSPSSSLTHSVPLLLPPSRYLSPSVLSPSLSSFIFLSHSHFLPPSVFSIPLSPLITYLSLSLIQNPERVIDWERERVMRGRWDFIRSLTSLLVYETYHRIHLSFNRVGYASSLLTPPLSVFSLPISLSSLSLLFSLPWIFIPFSLSLSSPSPPSLPPLLHLYFSSSPPLTISLPSSLSPSLLRFFSHLVDWRLS